MQVQHARNFIKGHGGSIVWQQSTATGVRADTKGIRNSRKLIPAVVESPKTRTVGRRIYAQCIIQVRATLFFLFYFFFSYHPLKSWSDPSPGEFSVFEALFRTEFQQLIGKALAPSWHRASLPLSTRDKGWREGHGGREGSSSLRISGGSCGTDNANRIDEGISCTMEHLMPTNLFAANCYIFKWPYVFFQIFFILTLISEGLFLFLY